MTDRITLAVLGGDVRQITMARELADQGYRVLVWGLGECEAYVGCASVCESWQSAVKEAHAVILPLPASMDGVRVHAPLHNVEQSLRVSTLLDQTSGQLLLAGRIGESMRKLAGQKGIEVIDYFESEVLQLKNAVPTAEGAIAIAMHELPVTIDGIHAAVIGYGRIGALLGERLGGLGANVTVYARRREQLVQAELHHHRVGRLVCRGEGTEPDFLAPGLRVIFNTVPQWIFTRRVLETLPKNCLLIDLASAPGGIDHTAAQELGIKTVWATALPGKCAPESAGRILAETIGGILSEEALAPTQYRKDD